MSKLVVDQIQKSGGAALTLPTASAGAANSLMVSDASGNLTFSTLGNLLPAGISGSQLTTDGSGNLSFTKAAVLIPDNNLIIGTVATSSARQNVYSTGEWSSSGPWTTYQNNSSTGTDANGTIQAWNMFTGDGYGTSGTTQPYFAHDYAGEYNREIHYAASNRVGDIEKTWFYYDNATSYGGVTWRVLPIRNTTATSISTTVYFSYSSYDTYNGASCGTFTPSGTSSLYSAQTGGTWSQGYTNTSNTISNASMSITVPANTTILVMLNTSHNYQTTYYFDESNSFHNLSTTFSTGLICDLRMLNTLAMARSLSNGQTTAYPHTMYTSCATLFGDR